MITTLKRGDTKKSLQELLNNLLNEVSNKGVDTLKYCGKIKIKKDALQIQNKLRNEW
jgi:hypothetical protein